MFLTYRLNFPSIIDGRMLRTNIFVLTAVLAFVKVQTLKNHAQALCFGQCSSFGHYGNMWNNTQKCEQKKHTRQVSSRTGLKESSWSKHILAYGLSQFVYEHLYKHIRTYSFIHSKPSKQAKEASQKTKAEQAKHAKLTGQAKQTLQARQTKQALQAKQTKHANQTTQAKQGKACSRFEHRKVTIKRYSRLPRHRPP